MRSMVPTPYNAAEPFEAAIEASPTGVLVVSLDGSIMLVNRLLERQFGYGRGELVGQPVDVLVPEALLAIRAAHREGDAQALAPRSIGVGRQLVARRRDGSQVPVEIELTPVPTPAGQFVLASVVDTTEQRRLEQLRRAAVEDGCAFERFVADLSSQFINLSAGEIDAAIRQALERSCRNFDLDRATFLRMGPDSVLSSAVSWERPGVEPIPAVAWTELPWTLERCRAGQAVSFASLDEVDSEPDRATHRALGTTSAIIFPLAVAGSVVGALDFSNVHDRGAWLPEAVHRLLVISSVFCEVLARRQSEAALQRAFADVQRLTSDLQAENVHLRREAREWLGHVLVVGKSRAVQRVVEQIQQVAETDSTVLLLGETGSGKELFATQVHDLSPRRHRAMVRMNCAAIPSTLIESELFGREKGAFTGALTRQVGRFELAHRSSIFLDEIGDLPSDVQVKLLRALDEGQIERLGSPHAIKVDVRIIAATHRNLEQRMAEGSFRADLFYRLNVFPIRVPPLRDRTEDIPLLAWRFIGEFSKAFGKTVDVIDERSLAALRQYPWPGNIRELRNVIERALITASGPKLTITLPQASASAIKSSQKLMDVEKEHVRAVLESTTWRIRGAGGAADLLGLKPTTLETRMVKFGLKRPGVHVH
jgi:formate hydrogenlyase transcriptional activator